VCCVRVMSMRLAAEQSSKRPGRTCRMALEKLASSSWWIKSDTGRLSRRQRPLPTTLMSSRLFHFFLSLPSFSFSFFLSLFLRPPYASGVRFTSISPSDVRKTLVKLRVTFSTASRSAGSTTCMSRSNSSCSLWPARAADICSLWVSKLLTSARTAILRSSSVDIFSCVVWRDQIVGATSRLVVW
jgi:hypothetical protein